MLPTMKDWKKVFVSAVTDELLPFRKAATDAPVASLLGSSKVMLWLGEGMESGFRARSLLSSAWRAHVFLVALGRGVQISTALLPRPPGPFFTSTVIIRI